MSIIVLSTQGFCLDLKGVSAIQLRAKALTVMSRPTHASTLPTSTKPSTLPPTESTSTLLGFPLRSLPNWPTGFPTPRVMTTFILRSPICKYLKSSLTSLGGCSSFSVVADLTSGGRADVSVERTLWLVVAPSAWEESVRVIG